MDIKSLIGDKLSFKDNEGKEHICTIINVYYKNNKINLELSKDNNKTNNNENSDKNN